MSNRDGRTHWETCWREHLDCAVERCDALKEALEGLVEACQDEPWDGGTFHEWDEFTAALVEAERELKRAALTPKEPSDG